MHEVTTLEYNLYVCVLSIQGHHGIGSRGLHVATLHINIQKVTKQRK